ncbi:hypothetical protein N7510_011609 [Penicillium lagena]|uniref:uncharacterized protein n=1 Tax=Penicillium lagena TaxID=94218 RepID=UPI002540950C|nr:uncharacterized protein N7510_011609 [Penicillium lagena]KAJ5602075.1 hypothetical protein N7510_011609 [Penicillium lagena]
MLKKKPKQRKLSKVSATKKKYSQGKSSNIFIELQHLLDEVNAPHELQVDRNADPWEGQETNPSEGQKDEELLPYHHAAQDEATQYLRTLYFALVENPSVGFYNPTRLNLPSPAAKEAISKLDEINGRLLTRNCFSGLNIAVGQIQWSRLVKTWKSILFASEDISPFAEEAKKRHMSALTNICKELHYPKEWANIPPGGPEEPHSSSGVVERKIG